MKAALRPILAAIVLAVPLLAHAGDIQLFCEPGLRVLLDGELVGTSSEREDGFVITDVSEGSHTIRVEKDGYVAQNIEVRVGPFPIEVTVGALSPAPVIRQRETPELAAVQQPVGNLVVTSAPQNCEVTIDGRSYAKTTPQLLIEDLVAGDHTITFSKPGFEPISGSVTDHPLAEATVRGNLKAGAVETLHRGKGALRIYSEPQRCTVRFRGEVHEKTGMVLNITHVPAGEYPIRISMTGGRELATRVTILDRHRTLLEVSFMDEEEPIVASHVPR